MIKTVSVSGLTEINFSSENEPLFYLSQKYVHVKNKSAGIVYISADENCTPDADGTASVSAGECRCMKLSSTNTLYFSGDGDIEVETSDTVVSPFKPKAEGGGGDAGDYNPILNKPQINHKTLVGNKSFEDLGLEWIKPDVIADEFDESKSYSENDFVMYNSALYKCTAEHSGAWNDADFEKTTVIECISEGGIGGNIVNEPTEEEIAASIAEIWG